MRKSSMVLASVLVVGLAVGLSFAEGAAAKHDLKAEFVSYDAARKTVTFKDESGKQNTVPVLESAMEKFATMKAGDQIIMTCADDANGGHLGVSMVKAAAQKSGK